MNDKLEKLKERIKQSCTLMSEQRAFKMLPEQGKLFSTLANEIYSAKTFNDIVPVAILNSTKINNDHLIVIAFNIDSTEIPDTKIDGIQFMSLSVSENDPCFTKTLIGLAASAIYHYNPVYNVRSLHEHIIQAYDSETGSTGNIFKHDLKDCPEEYSLLMSQEISI